MSDTLGTWAVQYDGQEWMHQNDATRPEFDDSGKEIPFRRIEWPRVTAVRFENAQVQSEFQIVQPPPGKALSMRRRMYMTHADGPDGSCSVMTMAFIILRHDAGVDVTDAAALAPTVDDATYWFPTGVVYQCAELNSGPAADYAQKLARCVAFNEPIPSLPGATNLLQTDVAATLE